MTDAVIGRRNAILAMGLGIAAGLAAEGAKADAPKMVLPAESGSLAELAAKLEKAPRRRDFKTVPMILTDKNDWDHEALEAVLAYRGAPRQAWDNTDIASPWLNGMRNALNTQVFSFRHPDFFLVSATHGAAHLALLDQAMWDKYQLSKLTGDKFAKNAFIAEQPGAAADPKDFENGQGVFSGHNVSVPALMRRGVVFLACHNSMWEIGEKLIKAGVNPDKLSHEAMAAELTNHIIAGCVLTPGIVGTLPELAAAGFSYVK